VSSRGLVKVERTAALLLGSIHGCRHASVIRRGMIVVADKS
jgi:hypothetical protein